MKTLLLIAALTQQIATSDLVRLRSVDEVEISPDGSRIVYSVVRNDRPGRPYSETFVMTVASGVSSRIGDASNARWSPDSRLIAYFGNNSLIVSQGDGTNP